MRRISSLLIALTVVISLGCASSRFNDDSHIQSRVQDSLASTMSGHHYTTSVSVNHGVVTLTGTAASEEERRMIGDTADKVKGVKTVINNVIVGMHS